jgi:hypothetical protein
VFRSTVRATDQTDIDAEAARFRSSCERAGLPSIVLETIVSQVRETLADLVPRGRDMAALGSQMTVTRTIAGDGYEVTISFNARKRRSIFVWIADALRGR